MMVPVPCPHGEFCARQLHAGTSGSPREGAYIPQKVLRRVPPRGGGRKTTPPHPAEIARYLPINESGGRWTTALRNVVQFAEFLQRDVPGPGPASYPTTSVCSSFELVVRAHGRSPTSSSLLCSLFSDALGPTSSRLPWFSPLEGMGKRLPAATVRYPPRSGPDCMMYPASVN